MWRAPRGQKARARASPLVAELRQDLQLAAEVEGVAGRHLRLDVRLDSHAKVKAVVGAEAHGADAAGGGCV